MRRRSRSPKAVRRKALEGRLGAWVRSHPACFYCERFRPDHAHHIVSKGSDASLKLCPANLMPLCCWCHQDFHDDEAFHDRFIESAKPGLQDYLKLLGRTTWLKKDLDEVEAEIDRVTKRPWSEFWESLEAA